MHMSHAEDGVVDCVGAIDERSYCIQYRQGWDPAFDRCLDETQCRSQLDFCFDCLHYPGMHQLCDQLTEESTNILDYLERVKNDNYQIKKPFSHTSSRSFPAIQSRPSNDNDDEEEIDYISIGSIAERIDDRHAWLCNRGILILVGQNETEQCLCPPSYYGNRCQYQNQRVSLTLRFRKQNPEKLDIIQIILTLIDHTDVVHAYEQITYVPSIDCNTKFNIYLLYQNRPKDITKNYTINIDAYNRVNMTYLTSWTLPIKHSFMPVNRVSAQLTIPAYYDCRLLCNHKYPEKLKNIDIHSCRCNSIQLNMISEIHGKCNCSPGSMCVGFMNNRSICLCPLKKAGPRCFLKSICETQTCANGGLCLPDDVRNSFTDYFCACPDGFSGKLCQRRDVSIEISFSDVKISQFLFIHLITVTKDKFLMASNLVPRRVTFLRKVLIYQNTITFNMALPFHLIFAEVAKSYYLIAVQHNYTSILALSTEITRTRRCRHIEELFDDQMLNYTTLHRTKYVHILCQNHSNLLCFYDPEVYMCLCTEERHANCFHFDFHMIYDCHKQNDCENGAQCFQDHPQCPKTKICACLDCFYGSKCQFSTKHSGLSLDAILGYHIYPEFSIIKQSAHVKVSIAIATVMLVIALTFGTLSALTFRLQTCQETGSGLYLYISTIISIITTIIFNLKLWFLILSQMNIITLRSFLLFNCITVELLLRSSLVIIDWLCACVAMERIFIAFFAINFNKKKSKRVAKLVIITIVLLTPISIIHDPIYRRLFDDIEEKRIWCLVRFPSNVDLYNTIINLFHFITPCLINFISAISIIVLTAKQRAKGKTQHTRFQQLKTQFHHHNHLIISSILLVILSSPRLIISFLPNCMKSPKEFQLLLAGYFISFIPALLIFFIFILTSKLYKQECRLLTNRIVNWFKNHLGFNRSTS